MLFPYRDFVSALKDQSIYNGSFFKQNNSLKIISTTMEPGMPLCRPDYTKNWEVRDLLGTPDPKYANPTFNIQGLRPLTARVQFNKYIEIRMVGYNGKKNKTSTPSLFWRV